MMYERLMTPMFSSMEDREKFINELEKKFDTFKEWSSHIRTHHSTMMELAAWFIFNNWEKVDWMAFEIDCYDTEYSNLVNKREYKNEIFKKIFEEIDAKKTPFKKLSFTYDETDGDLSIDVDGKWWFMDDEQILNAALYLEERL